jgi:uncharacterized protein
MEYEAFLKAIQNGETKTVRSALADEPRLARVQTSTGLSVVLLAAYYRHPQVASLLADGRSDLTIFEAAAVGDLERVRALLAAEPALAGAFAADGYQPLGLAAYFGQLEVARLLVENGAPVKTASRNEDKVMPLHSAVAAGQLEIARLLLEHGADPNAVQADEFVPLHEAAQNGDLPLLELLLAHGARDARNQSGKGAVAIAKEAGKEEAVKFLVDRGFKE